MIAVIRAHDGRQIIRHSAGSHAKCRQGSVKTMRNVKIECSIRRGAGTAHYFGPDLRFPPHEIRH